MSGLRLQPRDPEGNSMWQGETRHDGDLRLGPVRLVPMSEEQQQRAIAFLAELLLPLIDKREAA